MVVMVYLGSIRDLVTRGGDGKGMLWQMIWMLTEILKEYVAVIP